MRWYFFELIIILFTFGLRYPTSLIGDFFHFNVVVSTLCAQMYRTRTRYIFGTF